LHNIALDPTYRAVEKDEAFAESVKVTRDPGRDPAADRVPSEHESPPLPHLDQEVCQLMVTG
jgi:hypothetical protein